MTLEAKKKIHLNKIVERLREKGINVQICKRPSIKCIGAKNA